MGLITLGVDCKVFYLPIGTARVAWGGTLDASGIWELTAASAPAGILELSAVRNLNTKQAYGKADFSSRASRTKLVGLALEDLAYEMDVPYNKTDAGFLFLRAAYITQATVGLLIADGPIVAGMVGRWLDCVISEFPTDEPIEKETLVKCMAEPTASAVPPQWVKAI